MQVMIMMMMMIMRKMQCIRSDLSVGSTSEMFFSSSGASLPMYVPR